VIEVIPVDTPGLGDRSYLATDGSVAFVVDPQRDIDRMLAVADDHGVTITHVFETHIHNDYVTGGLALARHVGASYVISAGDRVSFPHEAAHDGDLVEVGQMRVRAIHTPGHTFTHLSYALESHGQTFGAFTGGSLLFGSTGRPDLLGPEHAEALARHQHASARRLADSLPPDTKLFPTHGFGSFCAATQAAGTGSTLQHESRTNPVLTHDADTYVRELLAGLLPFPAYYAHIAPLNAAGPAGSDLTPVQRADPAELRRRIACGEWVVDLRHRRAFAAAHVPGTLNFGIDGSFVTYLGWLIPWDTPVTLLADDDTDIAEAQRQLSRIGIDRPAACATGGPRRWSIDDRLASFRVAGFADLVGRSAASDPPYILDVRRDDEHADSHIAGCHHIPLAVLADRIAEVPRTKEVWVHCAGGYRASIAAAILRRSGRHVVCVDDDFSGAGSVGLEIAGRIAA
jgi:glyoxylase-like metal-dependent hydrolase (beta-lactamase superfamily II)/rhodanese-related sulfurtransferase